MFPLYLVAYTNMHQDLYGLNVNTTYLCPHRFYVVAYAHIHQDL